MDSNKDKIESFTNKVISPLHESLDNYKRAIQEYDYNIKKLTEYRDKISSDAYNMNRCLKNILYISEWLSSNYATEPIDDIKLFETHLPKMDYKQLEKIAYYLKSEDFKSYYFSYIFNSEYSCNKIRALMMLLENDINPQGDFFQKITNIENSYFDTVKNINEVKRMAIDIIASESLKLSVPKKEVTERLFFSDIIKRNYQRNNRIVVDSEFSGYEFIDVDIAVCQGTIDDKVDFAKRNKKEIIKATYFAIEKKKFKGKIPLQFYKIESYKIFQTSNDNIMIKISLKLRDIANDNYN